MTSAYFIVPDAIATANNGRVENDRGLLFVLDNEGRYVVNVEVAQFWPDIDWASFQIVSLTPEDFPQTYN